MLAALDVLIANVRSGLLSGVGGVVVVTSAAPREGRSTVAASLGRGLAFAGDVICVEADAGVPAMSAYLGAEAPEVGLLDVLTGRIKLNRALVSVGAAGAIEARVGERLHVAAAPAAPARAPAKRRVTALRLLAGRAGIGLATALTPEATEQLMTSLRAAARYTVIDAPPLLHGAGALALAAKADAVVVVARDGVTKRADAIAARWILGQLVGISVGVVLVGCSEPVSEQAAVLAERD
jgi:succinoglycan biosynthesis transport protein ExoP